MALTHDDARPWLAAALEDIRKSMSSGMLWTTTGINIRSNEMARGRVQGEGAFTKEAPPLREVVAPVGDEMVRAQAWFEDQVVRAVRKEGYCTEALRIMEKAFGKPLDTVGVYDTRGSYGMGSGSRSAKRLYPAYLDSDGSDCWGNVWRDADGYDRNGMDSEGRDRNGFDKDGYDANGFDRDGKDRKGFSRDDPARFGYDVLGYDADGYNREGFDRQGYNREGKNVLGEDRRPRQFVFDHEGYDVDGYNKDGYNRAGQHDDAKYTLYRRMQRDQMLRS